MRSFKFLSSQIFPNIVGLVTTSHGGTAGLQTQVVGRERVFSIFGKPRRGPPTANLDLTLGAACAEKRFLFFLLIFPH